MGGIDPVAGVYWSLRSPGSSLRGGATGEPTAKPAQYGAGYIFKQGAMLRKETRQPDKPTTFPPSQIPQFQTLEMEK
jgi:hypothetical protein